MIGMVISGDAPSSIVKNYTPRPAPPSLLASTPAHSRALIRPILKCSDFPFASSATRTKLKFWAFWLAGPVAGPVLWLLVQRLTS